MTEGHFCRSSSMQKLIKIYFINISNTSRLILLILMASTTWSKIVAFNLDIHHPIVFEDPSKDLGKETYFGYSVLLYSELGRNNSWIQIGAPRATSTSSWNGTVVEKGAVYRCQLSPLAKCRLVNVAGDGHNKDYFKEKEDGAWLGAAMDVQPGPFGRVVVCSPRWIHEFEKNYFMLGSCYWSTAEDDGNKSFTMLVPLADEERYVAVEKVYDFGLGGAGISVHMPLESPIEKTSKLVLGAPGLLNWKGGLVLYEDVHLTDNGSDIDAFSELILPTKQATMPFSDGDYTGYQVNSGNFFSHDVLNYVASAPKAAQMKGKVMLLSIKPRGGLIRKYHVKSQVFGIQCGEYFGASIAVGDLNDDNYDDLIVGAPFFSNEDVMMPDYDRGRIAVFLSTPLGIPEPMLKENGHIIGYKAGSRFGSVVAFLGDINSDNFPEVAVGAPYEDEGRGAVYIYSSDINGHLGHYVQRITARDCYEHLRGFGSSISLHNVDIDGNGCPDVAVGAHRSGHAVIYRGQPVIRWKVKNPNPDPVSILYNATHFTLKSACVTYLGKNAPNVIQIQRTLELDFTYFRCENLLVRKNLTLRRGEQFCDNLKILLKPNIRNVLNPMEVRITYELVEEKEKKRSNILVKGDKIHGKDSFCKECPITLDSPTAVLSIPFAVECGGDSVCTADLSVRVEIPELKHGLEEEILPFVTGSSSTITFQVLVSNNKTADIAYFTHLYIEIGAPASLSRFYTECHEISSLPFLKNFTEEDVSNSTKTSGSRSSPYIYLDCEIGDIAPGKEREVSVELDMTNTQGFNKMELAVWATTVNYETNPLNNWWSAYVQLDNEADITIVGKGVPEISPMILESKNESEININFTHYFEIQKFGPSIIDKASIELLVPMYITDLHSKKSSKFLTIRDYKGYQGNQPLSCIFDDTMDSDEGIPTKLHSIRKRSAIKDMSNISGNEVPSNRTLYVNCSSPAIADTHLIECRTVNCISGTFLNSRTVAKVSLDMEIDIQKLKSLMGPRHIILLKTQGFVKVIEPRGLQQPSNEKPDHAIAHSIFVADAPKKKLETWVLALAIAAGIMIMLFLVMALGKAGFFKRKKKHELKALKRQTLMEVSEDFLTNERLQEVCLQEEDSTD